MKQATEVPGQLTWHYGPTETDSDPGRMWCDQDDGEVWAFDGIYVCTSCGRESEE